MAREQNLFLNPSKISPGHLRSLALLPFLRAVKIMKISAASLRALAKDVLVTDKGEMKILRTNMFREFPGRRG